MSIKYTIEYANIVCRFGKTEMLDAFEQRFYPALKQIIKRKSGETYEYKVIDLQFQTIAEETFLTGRFLQRMNLKARQKFHDGQLKKTKASLGSDPTTIFMISLADHKMILIPEQPRSPKTKTVEYILKTFLRLHWDTLYKRERDRFLRKHNVKRLSKQLNEEFWSTFKKAYPEPSLELNPIGSSGNVATVLEAFAVVKSLRLTFNKPNNEDYALDEELIKLFGASVKRTNSNTATQEYRNPKEGLEEESVENLVTASTQTGGNCKFKISGESTTGEIIHRTDEHTKVNPKIEFEQSPTDLSLMRSALGKLNELIANGQILLAKIVDLDVKKTQAKSILRKYTKT